jgi:hypothetical protein
MDSQRLKTILFGVFEVLSLIFQGVFARKCQRRMDKRKKTALQPFLSRLVARSLP